MRRAQPSKSSSETCKRRHDPAVQNKLRPWRGQIGKATYNKTSMGALRELSWAWKNELHGELGILHKQDSGELESRAGEGEDGRLYWKV